MQLKSVKFWDAVEFNIPAHWDLHLQPAGNWGCYNEAHPATIWVDFKPVIMGGGDLLGDALVLGEEFVARPFSSVDVDFKSQCIANGHGVMNIRSTEYDEDDLLRMSWWHHVQPREGGMLYCHLTLVLPEEFAQSPEGDAMSEILNLELANAVIDWNQLVMAEKQKSS